MSVKLILKREDSSFPFLAKGYPRYSVTPNGRKAKIVYTNDINEARVFNSMSKAFEAVKDVKDWDSSFRIDKK